MTSLSVNVALWRAVTGPDGRTQTWALANHKFLPNVASSDILETASAPCVFTTKLTPWVVTTLHTAVPPPGFTPRLRFMHTTSIIRSHFCA